MVLLSARVHVTQMPHADMALFVFSYSIIPASFPSDYLYEHGMHQG
jgi:hypothetical protein